jgi:type I restriction-modification system DNA methylase subunit
VVTEPVEVLPSLLLCKAGRQPTSTHAPLIPSLSWVQVERGASRLQANVVMIYDGACGSGGMLTESQDFITDPEGEICSNVPAYLYGKEINPETYAICKSDMMIKGNDPENIKFGSTLSTDEFAGIRFDFMLSNPPYGKSYKSEQKFILDGKEVLDPRFQVRLKNFQGIEETVAATPRSSDGQLLFLIDMVSKMKPLSASPLGTRIASVHNGSSLFTGDAGSGESNIRRHIIENDWLEAIIQLPNNMFYNTGITTYVWVLSNNKLPQRKGKVQLIDGSELYQKLRKNLGAKNCEFAPEHIEKITHLYLEMQPSPPSTGSGRRPAPLPAGYPLHRSRCKPWWEKVLEMGCAISSPHKPSNSLPGSTHLCAKSEKNAIPLADWARNSPKTRDGFRRSRIPEDMHGIGYSDLCVMDSPPTLGGSEFKVPQNWGI